MQRGYLSSSPVLRFQGRPPYSHPHFCCHPKRGNLSSWRSTVCKSTAHIGPASMFCSHILMFFIPQTGGDLLYCFESFSLTQVISSLGTFRGSWYFRHSKATHNRPLAAALHLGREDFHWWPEKERDDPCWGIQQEKRRTSRPGFMVITEEMKNMPLAQLWASEKLNTVII